MWPFQTTLFIAKLLTKRGAYGPRYVCANCDDDPLHDPIARKWADGPLRPPVK